MILVRMIMIACLGSLSMGMQVQAAESTIFGPEKYEVKERYGKPNTYSVSVNATEAYYLVKLQNGDTSSSRSDLIALSINGLPAVLDDRYPYAYIACFVKLAKENTFELVLKDERPSGFRRPRPIPKSVTMTVLPVPAGMASLRGSFGLMRWEGLHDLLDGIRAIKTAPAAGLAMDALSLSKSVAEQAEAIRNLSDLKEPSADNYLVKIYGSLNAPYEVRAEAALAIAVLGNPSNIPLLLKGIVDSDERIRIACARGLSFFPEDKTEEELTKILTRLDSMRRRPTMDSIAESGWRPIKTMEALAKQQDPVIVEAAIEFMGKIREPRFTDLLLTMLKEQNPQNMNAVIRALGETGDGRATVALLAIAADPQQRAGKEVDLADALANLGDQRAAPLIGEMIKKAQLIPVENRLRNAYRKLTGKNY